MEFRSHKNGNSLYDSLDFLKKENSKLKLQNAKLDQENNNLQIHEESGSYKTSEKASLLEKKIYRLQEELTELHRKKGECAQQVIDLRSVLDEKNKELMLKDGKLQVSETACEASEAVCENLRYKVSELELNSQFMKDEYDALLITYMSLETKNLKLEQEHQDMMSRWMAMETKDVEILKLAGINSLYDLL